MTLDHSLIDLGIAAVFPHTPIKFGVCKHFQAQPGYPFEASGLQGLLVLTKTEQQQSGQFYYCLFLIDGYQIVFSLMLPSVGEFGFRVSNEDCLVLDDPRFVNMFLFVEKSECQTFYSGFLEINKLNIEQNRSLILSKEDFTVLQMGAAPQIISQDQLDNLTDNGLNNVHSIFRDAVFLFLSVDVKSPQLYLSLVSLFQFYLQGCDISQFDNHIVAKTVQVIYHSSSSLVVDRAIKLLHILLVRDDAVVKLIASNKISWITQDNQEISFFDVFAGVLSDKCMKITDSAVLYNDNVLLSVVQIISLIYGSNFVFDGVSQEVRREESQTEGGKLLSKSICKIFNAKDLKKQLRIPIEDFFLSGMQRIFGILVGILIYVSRTQGAILSFPQDSTQVAIDAVRLDQQIQHQDEIELSQELINVLSTMIEVGNHYHRVATQHAKPTEKQITTKNLQLPLLVESEFDQLLAILLTQLDLEFASYVIAFQSEKLLQYYIDSQYCHNFSAIFRFFSFMFDSLELESSTSVQSTQIYYLLQKCFLQNNNMLGKLIRYLHFVSHSQAFFMDMYLVSLYDNLDIDYFVDNVGKFLITFIMVVNSISSFIIWHYVSVQTQQPFLEDINNIIFSIYCNIITKFIVCMTNSDHNTFIILFKSEHIDVLSSIYKGFHDFLVVIDKRRQFGGPNSFYKSFYLCFATLVKFINTQNSLQSHHLQRIVDILSNFLSTLFALLTEILTYFMKTDPESAQNTSLSIPDVVLDYFDRNVKLDTGNIDIQFHIDQQRFVDNFRENLIVLFKIFMLGRKDNLESIDLDLQVESNEETLRLVEILTVLLSERFAQDTQKINKNLVIDEIKLFDKLIKTINFPKMGPDALVILEQCLNFNGELINVIRKYKEVDILKLNLMRSFVNSMDLIFSTDIDDDTIFEAVDHATQVFNLQFGIFNTCILMMETILQVKDEFELQDLSPKMFAVMLRFYRLPYSFSDIISLIRFLFDRKLEFMIQHFLELASRLIELPYHGKDSVKEKLDLQVSQISQYFVTLVFLDGASSQTQAKYQLMNLNLLKQEVNYKYIIKLFIRDDMSIWNVNSRDLWVCKQELQSYSFVNDITLIKLSKQLLNSTDNLQDCIIDNGVYILFHSILKICNRIKNVDSFLSLGDVILLKEQISSDLVEGLYDILENRLQKKIEVQLNYTKDDVQVALVIIRILSMLFDAIPDHMVQIEAYLQSLLLVIQIMSENQDLEQVLLVTVLKMLYIQINDDQRKTNKQMDKVFEFVLHFTLQNNQKQPNHISANYYCFHIINGLLENTNNSKVPQIFICKDAYLNMLILTSSTILNILDSDKDKLLGKQIIQAAVSIIYNVINLNLILIKNPDQIQCQDDANIAIVDSAKVKERLYSSLQFSCFVYGNDQDSSNFENCEIKKTHLVVFFDNLLKTQWLMNELASESMKFVTQILQIMCLLTSIEPLKIEKLLSQQQYYNFLQVFIIILMFSLQRFQSNRIEYIETLLQPKLLESMKLRYPTLCFSKSADTLLYYAKETVMQQIEQVGNFEFLEKQCVFQQQIVDLFYHIFRYRESGQFLEKLSFNIYGLIDIFFYSIDIFGQYVELTNEQHQQHRKFQVIYQVTQSRAANIIYIFAQVTETCKYLLLNNHLDKICNYLDNIQFQLSKEKSFQRQKSELEMSNIRIEQLKQKLIYYISITKVVCETSVFKQKIADCNQLLVTCSKLMINCDIQSQSLYDNIASIIYSAYDNETIPTLVLTNKNKGMNGIPILQISLELLNQLYNNKDSPQKISDEIKLMILNMILGLLQYSRTDQDKQQMIYLQISNYIHECYDLAKEIQFAEQSRQCIDAAIKIINAIEQRFQNQ